MELKSAIEIRRSIREFIHDPVDMSDIRELIRLAGFAPSVDSTQPWKYYVVTNRSILEKMALAVGRAIDELPENNSRMAKTVKSQAAWFSTFFTNAPMLIVLAGRSYETYLEKGITLTHEKLEQINRFPDLQSAGASIQNLLLAATDKGYGTCWMTGPLYAKEVLENLLDIEAPWELISCVAIGKPAARNPKNRERRNLAEELVMIS